jgi:hypothetical protein
LSWHERPTLEGQADQMKPKVVGKSTTTTVAQASVASLAQSA